MTAAESPLYVASAAELPRASCARPAATGLHSRRESRLIREKCSSDGGGVVRSRCRAVAVPCCRRAPRRPRVAATARGRSRAERLRCVAGPRSARGRGWGGVRLRCCAGPSRGGVGLKGAAGSIRPRGLKHRSGRCRERGAQRVSRPVEPAGAFWTVLSPAAGSATEPVLSEGEPTGAFEVVLSRAAGSTTEPCLYERESAGVARTSSDGPSVRTAGRGRRDTRRCVRG